MDNPMVTVKQGLLRGVVQQLNDGSQYYSFKGIPYAEPPVGELRFKSPQPPKPWTGIYEATEHGSVCPQIDILTKEIIEGNEDCLFLNVYTNSLRKESGMPVMVFIHGGAFYSGSGNSDLYGPDFIVQNDVVLVTINYRLEAFGFLCLDTPEIPGNAGMKDQVAALRWVQDNIAQFGGDSNNVTIFGESAGSASVTHQMLSPMAKGLFHKVIAQSGVSAHYWAVAKNAKKTAFKVGKVLGKNTTDVNELVDFFKTVPATALIGITSKLLSEDDRVRNAGIVFSPVVEKKFDGIVPFITEDPLDVLRSSNVQKPPLMIGYTSAEGLFFAMEQLKYIDVVNTNFEYNVPKDISDVVSNEKMKAIGEKIKKFYAGKVDYSKENILEFCTRFGDNVFIYPTHRFSHKYSKLTSQVYMYRFSCDTELNFLKNALGLSKFKGACHADDLFYLFHNQQIKHVYENQDLLGLILKMTKMWTNFAKFGNPTPDNDLGVKWPSYTTEGKEFLDMDETLSVSNYADRERVQFWDQLYHEAGLPSMESN